MSDIRKYVLEEGRIPRNWYNIAADLPKPLPPVLHPATGKPIGPDDLSPLFPMPLIQQEVTQEREIEIPTPVRDMYRLWRPTPLFRARNLEQVLETPAKIYYKYEGVSPAGSHKPNTAVPQAFYNKETGTKTLTTETGAGQWGSALAFACAHFKIELEVFMVRVSFDQKPYRRALMESYGAHCTPSPSKQTEAGRNILANKYIKIFKNLPIYLPNVLEGNISSFHLFVIRIIPKYFSLNQSEIFKYLKMNIC